MAVSYTKHLKYACTQMNTHLQIYLGQMLNYCNSDLSVPNRPQQYDTNMFFFLNMEMWVNCYNLL